METVCNGVGMVGGNRLTSRDGGEGTNGGVRENPKGIVGSSELKLKLNFSCAAVVLC